MALEDGSTKGKEELAWLKVAHTIHSQVQQRRGKKCPPSGAGQKKSNNHHHQLTDQPTNQQLLPLPYQTNEAA